MFAVTRIRTGPSMAIAALALATLGAAVTTPHASFVDELSMPAGTSIDGGGAHSLIDGLPMPPALTQAGTLDGQTPEGQTPADQAALLAAAGTAAAGGAVGTAALAGGVGAGSPTSTTAIVAAIAADRANIGVGALSIPARVLTAYQVAASTTARTDPGCRLQWPLLASIGRIESGHARGGAVSADGTTLAPILGPVLAGGSGVAAIRDTDNGRFDGDKVWDRAVGPMQFIPSSWALFGRDGNGDGVKNPNNVDDAALAAAGYLCGHARDLSKPSDQRAAVLGYNHSDTYANAVLAWMDSYANGQVRPVSSVPAGLGSAGSGTSGGSSVTASGRGRGSSGSPGGIVSAIGRTPVLPGGPSIKPSSGSGGKGQSGAGSSGAGSTGAGSSSAGSTSAGSSGAGSSGAGSSGAGSSGAGSSGAGSSGAGSSSAGSSSAGSSGAGSSGAVSPGAGPSDPAGGSSSSPSPGAVLAAAGVPVQPSTPPLVSSSSPSSGSTPSATPGATPTPTPTPSPTPTAVSCPTPTPSPTVTASPGVSPTPTVTPPATVTPTPTPDPSAPVTPTLTPTVVDPCAPAAAASATTP